ncbi:MAG: hypothetical protein KDJ37_00225 [Hyphomicrobiaceae bacterium]|nr:hypothetical protein [Hyphomicrobiaceae bacterium]
MGKAELQSLLAELYGLRHVTIRIEPEGETRAVDFRHPGAVGWVLRQLPSSLQPEPIRLPIATRLGPAGTLVIAPNPGDELSELLDEILQISLAGGLICFVLFAVTTNVVTRSFKPIEELRRALLELEDGRYSISLTHSGPPELRTLASGISSLATALGDARSENARLSSMLVRLQDQERQEIARELHDEFGPHLFAARARLALLKSALGREPPDVAAAHAASDRLAEEINDIQTTNRRVLQRLEPAGLKELGLAAALEDMVDRWRQEQASVELELTLPRQMPALDATHALTIYRVVQEGLTNAYRHAAASRIEVQLRCLPQHAMLPDGATTEQTTLEIEVRDNGRGLPDGYANGFGLSAMRQRVVALGGTWRVNTIPTGGVLLSVLLAGISGASTAARSSGDSAKS